ncbi:ABC transporter ATP-binding protein [Candidatus Margulisiibacteriota bacterium]
MLEVKNLSTEFTVGENRIKAVDNISFEIPPQTVVGLVGESGSGKSVTSYSILNLLAANGRITAGKVLWKGEDLCSQPEKKLREIRGPEIGLIFQNPLAALNPVFTVGNQLMETLRLHQKIDENQAKMQAVELMRKVSIPDPEQRIKDYPHQFSMGMCQRIMIALTICANPQLLIADEPTASLDVTIQAQIIDLLKKIKQELQMSMLFISHDLGVIAQICDYILIMYLGKIVEKGHPKDIFYNALHPYTKALISSIPVPDPTIKTEYRPLKGDVPSVLNLPKGCRFHPRCPHAMPKCSQEEPFLKKHKDSEVACFLYE